MSFTVQPLPFLIFLTSSMVIGGHTTTRRLPENAYGGRDPLNVVFVSYGPAAVNTAFNAP